jgi:alpha-L-fucosidase
MNRRAFLSTSGVLAAAAPFAPRLLAADPKNTPAPKSSATKAPAAPDPNQPPALAPHFGDARDWWFKKRFGLFVHWGLYSIEGWHEQDQWRRRIPRADYVKLQTRWNPAKFNPDAWLDAAEAAGMRYICLTTKHHDGFCLFDSKHTDYTSAKSPYGRDLVRQLADACTAANSRSASTTPSPIGTTPTTPTKAATTNSRRNPATIQASPNTSTT